MKELQSMVGEAIVRQSVVKAALWFLLPVLAASCMEFYVARIWSAGQPPQFGDLYAPWWGAHELFLHNRNPYSPPVAREIQTVIYGAPQPAGYRGEPSELAGGFAYPLYAAFLLWPTVHLAFSTVQTVFLYASLSATAGSLLLWLLAFHFRPPPAQLVALALLTLGSFPVLQGIRLQNLSLIGAGLLAATLALITTGHLTLAGAMLAASTFKPQFTIVLVPWLALWTLGDWRRRQSLAWSFLAFLLLLAASAEWLMPGWVGGFLRVVAAYRQYTFGHSLLDVWFTLRGGPIAAVALLLVLFTFCWPYRQHSANSPAAFVVISLMLAATLVVVPTLAPHTQLLLLPGFLCLLRYRSLLREQRFARLALLAVSLLLAWPWIAAIGLTLAASLFPLGVLLRWQELPLYTSPVLPFAVLIALSFLIRSRTWPDQDFGSWSG
jgi:hypothetical protein